MVQHERARPENLLRFLRQPSVSAREIAFTYASDVWIVDRAGGVARRLTSTPAVESSPVFSPDGDLIAFTKQEGGRFYIGVIGIDGKGERLLSESYLDEGPDWSPNGRVIVFFRENRPGAGAQLWSVDLSGRNERRVMTQTDASDPAWSPVLE